MNFGVKLNFVGLMAALNSLATGRIQNANPAVFDALKMNSDTPIYDLLLKNAWICNGTGVPLFKGDVAIRHELRGETNGHAIIADVGDLGVFSAHEIVDCAGSMITPGLIAWDPEKTLFGGGRTDREYLEGGIVTVLETGDWQRAAERKPEPERWRKEARLVHWGYLLVGGPSGKNEGENMSLADWLAAGARAWITDGDGVPPETGRIPGWFGVQSINKDTADKYRIPALLEGNPASVIPRWTSEAARQFGLARRGTIAVGASADLVIWSTPANEAAPSELRDCKPSRVILNGRPVDLSNPVPIGRFIGRP
jgi:dihydroorotase-like cyclic amidohydrolase